MSGTIKHCSVETLRKMIKQNWPGFSITGSTPYRKGVQIKNIETKQVVDSFPSNYALYITMLEAVTKKTGWVPGKTTMPDLFGNITSEICENEKNFLLLCNSARKALDLRREADNLFQDLNISPYSKRWEKQLQTIINKRRKV